MGCTKKLCENRKKKMSENHKTHVKERGAARVLFYSICAVAPVFITGVRIKEIECAISFRRFKLKKCIFYVVLYKIWKKLSP